jgi:WD40 repeat protein
VSAGIDGKISYWNAATGKHLAAIKPEKPNSDLFCLDYSRDGAKLAAAGKRRSIMIYDDEKRTVALKLRHKGQIVNPGHSNRIFALRFDDTGKQIISAGWDMTVKIWDLNTGTVVRSIFGPEVEGDAMDVVGDMLITGSHRSKDSLQLWSIGNGKLIDTIDWDPEKPDDSSLIFSAQFEKGNRFMAACGSGRNEARIFEKRMDKPFAFACGAINLPSPCSSIDISNKDNLMAVGCCDGICRLFERIEKGKRESSYIPEKAHLEFS